MKTIFALASGHGKAGVAVLRLSGPKAFDVLRAMIVDQPFPETRYAAYVTLYDNGDVLDKALALCFKSPHSFTGEDVVELHLHGSYAVLHDVSACLLKLGCAPAEAGEFTKRAFLNGKLDLTAVEGLADLIAAETKMQRKMALSQMGGHLRDLYDGWRAKLLGILAYTEAEIDFADDDVPQDLIEKSRKTIANLMVDIKKHLETAEVGQRLRAGIRVALIGAPNAGKSTLLNALAKRDVAIVSDEAGTTRDVLEVHLDLEGLPVIVADTAGIRETGGKIEQEGIRRAEAWAMDADFQIMLIDAQKSELDAKLRALVTSNTFFVLNKIDLAERAVFSENPLYKISAQKGLGLDVLLSDLTQKIKQHFTMPQSAPLTRLRYVDALQEALEHLRCSQNAALPELVAEDYRLAMRALGRITGAVDVEDLLDVIFKDFCVGK